MDSDVAGSNPPLSLRRFPCLPLKRRVHKLAGHRASKEQKTSRRGVGKPSFQRRAAPRSPVPAAGRFPEVSPAGNAGVSDGLLEILLTTRGRVPDAPWPNASLGCIG